VIEARHSTHHSGILKAIRDVWMVLMGKGKVWLGSMLGEGEGRSRSLICLSWKLDLLRPPHATERRGKHGESEWTGREWAGERFD
jgi:hypothetical protein